MDLKLQGKVILVVGGHGLIGSAIVERIRAEGAVAYPASRHAPNGIAMDAADDAAVAAAIEQIYESEA